MYAYNYNIKQLYSILCCANYKEKIIYCIWCEMRVWKGHGYVLGESNGLLRKALLIYIQYHTYILYIK
jgi:hypothetical protein